MIISVNIYEEQVTIAVVLVNNENNDQPVSVSYAVVGNCNLSDFNAYVVSGKADLKKQNPMAQDEMLIVRGRSIKRFRANITY